MRGRSGTRRPSWRKRGPARCWTSPPISGRPLADVVERLLGRDLAVEISETVRSSQATSIPIEWHKRDYLLVVQIVRTSGDARHCALFWRSNAGLPASPGGTEMRQALMRARRRIRDLSRDDPVTGLLNETAFREVLAHDWAVAARERGGLRPRGGSASGPGCR